MFHEPSTTFATVSFFHSKLYFIHIFCAIDATQYYAITIHFHIGIAVL
jgi:hypothetical protein